MSEGRYSDSNFGGKGIGSGSGSLRPSSSALDSGPSPWLQQQQKGANRSKWLIWGAVFGVVGLAIVGIVVGVVVSKNNSKSSSSSSSSGVIKQTDPNDPSTFVKDSRLHQSFYGMAYTPKDSQLPGCGNKLADVITDVQLMSQLTKRIRLYGSDCNQTALVLEAIKRTKVDMEVFLGNYPVPTDGGEAYRRQRDAMKEAIKTYGTDHIAGVTVGNEFYAQVSFPYDIPSYLNANGATDANSATGDTGAALLIANIDDTRQMLADLSLSKTLPVGTSDAGSYFNTKVLEAVDYGMANVHPWFANVSAEQSAAWTANFFQEVDVAAASALSNNPKMYIAETGWPTDSSDAGNANNGASPASVAGLQTFMDTFVCQANTNGTGYFFFEFFDEPWKDAQFGGVEGWWGLFTSDRKLKNITIPTCTAP
ncbi:glycoside hydrolase [Coprinellus micaceus]|uniref:glucan endo-1,3-beta-D-glucosidase n=1 Tax=Coprinellus micaceus TaxID=71717 RepID=A0A4Y7SZD5_COPMI|nr:glycoside hydrolase [Coprinellus micaceus]